MTLSTRMRPWVLAGLAAIVAACADGAGRQRADAGLSGGPGQDTGSTAGGEATGSGEATASTASTGSPDGDGPSPIYDVGQGDVGPLGCGDEESFSNIWIANSEQGTVSKIDTTTGIELARYRTSEGVDSPSRTSVNQLGDVAVANRSPEFSVTKIAARRSQCIERNGVGGIQTSAGPDDVLAWESDECVLWKTVFDGNADYNFGPRPLAWEGGAVDLEGCAFELENPRLWVVHRQQVDGTVTFEIFRLDGETGTVLDHVSYQPLVGGGVPYGGAVNGKGDLWFIARASIDDSKLLRVDTDTFEVDEYLIDSPGKPYGMTVNADGDPWVAINNSGEFDDRLLRFDVSSQSFVTVSPTERVREYRGIQIDRQGRVWVAVNNPCGLDLFDANDSTLLASDIDVPGCPIGISIDRDGFVWMVDRDSDAARRLNPDTLAVDLEVEGLVAPYTYSDMTGQGLNLVTTPSG